MSVKYSNFGIYMLHPALFKLLFLQLADFHTLLEVFGLQYDHTLRPDTFYHGILGVGAFASFIQMKESPRFGELTMQCSQYAHPDSILYGTSPWCPTLPLQACRRIFQTLRRGKGPALKQQAC